MRADLEEGAGAIAARIPDGASVALPPDYSGCAMEAVRALIARGARGLHLIGIPQLGFQAELLVGAGCVALVETAAVTLGEAGPAPRFCAAVTEGTIEIRDSTCPAIHAGLQAAEKGLPFMPSRGIIGSDLLAHRPDWTVIDNPFEPHDPVVALPAIHPDVALFHAPLADREGNVWVGVRRELMLAAHAARLTLVTVEALSDASLLADPLRAPGTIPALYVGAIAVVPGGARPVGLAGCYEPEPEHVEAYARRAASAEGFAAYLAEQAPAA